MHGDVYLRKGCDAYDASGYGDECNFLFFKLVGRNVVGIRGFVHIRHKNPAPWDYGLRAECWNRLGTALRSELYYSAPGYHILSIYTKVFYCRTYRRGCQRISVGEHENVRYVVTVQAYLNGNNLFYKQRILRFIQKEAQNGKRIIQKQIYDEPNRFFAICI